jgi:hypothetical protein
MATYYWLGLSAGASGATQNCNIVSNWSLWGPGASGIFSSTSVPGYNDSVVFCKFGTVAPLHPPFGQMIGVSGPAGNTAAQFFVNVGVSGDYPLSLGTGGQSSYINDDVSALSKPFTFAAQILSLNYTMGTESPGAYQNIIGLKDNSGITKDNTTILYNNSQFTTYRILGTAKTIKRNPNNQGRELSNFRLQTLELTSPVYGIDSTGILNNNSTLTTFNVGPNTSIVGSIALDGSNVRLLVNKGFALDDTSDVALELKPAVGTAPKGPGPGVLFLAQDGSGNSGPDYVARTYIETLRTTTRSTAEGYINVDHGIDCNKLEQDGSNIRFGSDIGGNTSVSVIQEGSFNNTNSHISITNGVAQLGSNGDFIIHNVDPSQRINITPISTDGSTTYNLDLTPVSGWTGV